MRVLDLYCGAGMAGEGYRRALFDVVANAEAQGWSEFMLNDARTAIAKAEGSAR
jgi:hypothetical protein